LRGTPQPGGFGSTNGVALALSAEACAETAGTGTSRQPGARPDCDYKPCWAGWPPCAVTGN